MIPTHKHIVAIHVCTDCYFTHHNGAHEDPDKPGVWYAGDSDEPCDRKPLSEIPDGRDITDWTDSDLSHDVVAYQRDNMPLRRLDTLTPHELEELSDLIDRIVLGDGIDEFSRSSCDGCGSTLGGARYRLALWDAPVGVGPSLLGQPR